MTLTSASTQPNTHPSRRPLPLVDPQELARRNNESSQSTPLKRRTKSALLNKITASARTTSRPLRAVGFFID